MKRYQMLYDGKWEICYQWSAFGSWLMKSLDDDWRNLEITEWNFQNLKKFKLKFSKFNKIEI